MNVIQQLETLGQSGSLKQFASVSEMLMTGQVDGAFLTKVNKNNIELICFIEPDDDDDEN